MIMDREQIDDCQEEGYWERDGLGAWVQQMQNIMLRIDKQKSHPVYTGKFIDAPGINHNGK